MKKIVLVFTMVMILCCLFTIYSFADITFGDMVDHWASENVEVLTQKGIVAGWDGLFHPNELVRANEYIKMVVTALGHTDIQNYPGDWARDYIIKAIQLELVYEGEITDYNAPINRGMMAKIAMRALKDETVPDYIEAYKGMIRDYDNIPADIQLDILKCVQKGILRGMPDSMFRPEANCTRAEASTVIHRMISQEERIKAMPVFSNKDYEFEAIINGAEAEQYINMDHIEYHGNGIISVGTWSENNSEKLLLPVGTYQNINRDLYNLLAVLAKKAKQYDGYVRVLGDSERRAIIVEYFSQRHRGQGFMQGFSEFKVYIHAIPQYGEGYFPELKDYLYTWCLNSLRPDKYDYDSEVGGHPSMTDIIQSAFCAVYGVDNGLKLTEHALQEYDNVGKYFPEYENETFEVIGNVKIKNQRNKVTSLGMVTFSTVIPE